MCNSVTKNLGLGEGSALPVGVPVPWPSATPPTGWLKCNGATFTAALYPKLALAYPSGKLPDLRGEFIRGWDDGRGVDNGRALLSGQSGAIENITGSIIIRACTSVAGSATTTMYSPSGAYWTDGIVDAGSDVNALSAPNANSLPKVQRFNFDASRSVSTAKETRPRNITYNYIVRAA